MSIVDPRVAVSGEYQPLAFYLQKINDAVATGNTEITNLQSAINAAAAAGAGANGWPALLVQDSSGLNQQQVNDKTNLRFSELPVSVLDYIPTIEHAAIRAGTSTYDCTDGFIAAASVISSRSGGELVIPTGTYIVGRQTFAGAMGKGYAYAGVNIIDIKNCTRPVIIKGQGSVLKAPNGLKFGAFSPITGEVYTTTLPFLNTSYAASIGIVMNLENNVKVSIENLEIDGNDVGAIIGGLWGDRGRQLIDYGVRLRNNSLVSMTNVHIHHKLLDGLYVANSFCVDDTSLATPVLLTNVVSEYNARQAFSWGGGKGLTAINCKFNYSGQGVIGTSPIAGVDIEAEIGKIRDGLFINCEMAHNGGTGMVADSGDTANVKFQSCKFIGSLNSAVWVNKPSFTFTDCLIFGMIEKLFNTDNKDLGTKFINTLFTDEVKYAATKTGITQVNAVLAKNALFLDCSFIATRSIHTYTTSAIYKNCYFYSTTGTDVITNKNYITHMPNCVVKGCTFVTNITSNVPVDGFYINIPSAEVVDCTLTNTGTGVVRWSNWSSGGGGFEGYYAGDRVGGSPVPSLRINKQGRLNGWAGAQVITSQIAAPTTGDWIKGDIAFNSNVVAGGAIGWVCTVSGTSGTWVPFGTIQGTAAYTPTGATTKRAFDASTATTADLANTLATLINDLKTSKVLL